MAVNVVILILAVGWSQQDIEISCNSEDRYPQDRLYMVVDSQGYSHLVSHSPKSMKVKVLAQLPLLKPLQKSPNVAFRTILSSSGWHIYPVMWAKESCLSSGSRSLPWIAVTFSRVQ